MALTLLDRPMPKRLVMGEVGMEEEPVFVGSPLGSPRYEPLELVRTLNLDGLNMYLFLRCEGIQQYVMAGGRIKSRADLARICLPDPDAPALYEPYHRFLDAPYETGLARLRFLNLGSDPVIPDMRFETLQRAILKYSRHPTSL